MSQWIRNSPEIKILIDERRILSRLGLGNFSKKTNAKLRIVVREEADRALKLIMPRWAAVLIDAAELPDEAVFKDAKNAALGLCTIGSELEQACTDLMSAGEIFRGFVLDVIGSEAVSIVASQAVSWLSREGRAHGLRASKPFSPGIDGWDIGGQQFIFRMLSASTIGVSLSGSFMMSPRKSRSFRINYAEF